jgi:hypothetical protein
MRSEIEREVTNHGTLVLSNNNKLLADSLSSVDTHKFMNRSIIAIASSL